MKNKTFNICLGCAVCIISILVSCEDKLERKEEQGNSHFEPCSLTIYIPRIELEQKEIDEIPAGREKALSETRGQNEAENEMGAAESGVTSTEAQSKSIGNDGEHLVAMQIRNSSTGEVLAELFKIIEEWETGGTIKLPAVSVETSGIKILAYILKNGVTELYSDEQGFAEPFASGNNRAMPRNRWLYEDFRLGTGTNMLQPKVLLKDSVAMVFAENLIHFYSETVSDIDEGIDAVTIEPLKSNMFKLKFKMQNFNPGDSLRYVFTDAEQNVLSDTMTAENVTDLGEGVYETGDCVFSVLPTTDMQSLYISFINARFLNIEGETFEVNRIGRMSQGLSVNNGAYLSINVNYKELSLWDETDDGIIFYINETDQPDPDLGVYPGDYLVASLETQNLTLAPEAYVNEFNDYFTMSSPSNRMIPDVYIRQIYAMGEYCTREAAKYYRGIEGMDNTCAYIYSKQKTQQSGKYWFLPNNTKMKKLFDRYKGGDKAVLRKLFEGCWSGYIPPGGITYDDGGYVLSSSSTDARLNFLTENKTRLIRREKTNRRTFTAEPGKEPEYKEAYYLLADMRRNSSNVNQFFPSKAEVNKNNYFNYFYGDDFTGCEIEEYLPGGFGDVGCEGGKGIVAYVNTNKYESSERNKPLEHGLVYGDALVIEEGVGRKVAIVGDEDYCEGRSINDKRDWFLPSVDILSDCYPFLSQFRYMAVRQPFPYGWVGQDKPRDFYHMYSMASYSSEDDEMSESGRYPEPTEMMSGYIDVSETEPIYQRCMRIHHRQRNAAVFDNHSIEELRAAGYTMEYLLNYRKDLDYKEIYTMSRFLAREDITSLNQIVGYVEEERSDGYYPVTRDGAKELLAHWILGDYGSYYVWNKIMFVNLGQTSQPPGLNVPLGHGVKFTYDAYTVADLCEKYDYYMETHNLKSYQAETFNYNAEAASFVFFFPDYEDKTYVNYDNKAFLGFWDGWLHWTEIGNLNTMYINIALAIEPDNIQKLTYLDVRYLRVAIPKLEVVDFGIPQKYLQGLED